MVASSSDKRSLAIMLFVTTFVVVGTIIVSYLARGYQISFRKGPILTSTGLLSATSRPKSASVYVNDRLITATDDTLNLPPGSYQIKITKDGYLAWSKTIQIKKETVYQTDAQLFRSSPDLKPLTFTGALNPAVSDDGTKIIFAVASASASRDNGLYLVELTDNPLSINKNVPRQVSPNYPNVDWSKATFKFSPSSRQVLVQLPSANYLLNIDSPITSKSLLDITPQLSVIASDWQQQLNLVIQSRLTKLPSQLQSLAATSSARDLSFSPNEDKILYLAKADGSLPEHLIAAPPAQSTQTQNRQIKKDGYYVYDLKDDTNFLIGTKDKILNPQWLPNSNNLVFVNDQAVKVVEYDGTNQQTVFAGKFDQNSVYLSADGLKVITLTSAYDGSPLNLYTITIR